MKVEFLCRTAKQCLSLARGVTPGTAQVFHHPEGVERHPFGVVGEGACHPGVAPLAKNRHRFAVGILFVLGAAALAPLARAQALGPVISGTGVPDAVEDMYRRGLRGLAAAQNAGGSFDDGQYGVYPGVVGLAGVAFLAHGDDPNTGPYAANLRRCVDYIIASQRTDGYIMGNGGGNMYSHCFATLFLAESYGMVNDDRIGPALKKAVDLIVAAQAQNPLGAWRYSPDASDADSTVSGAATVALVAAANAGIEVPADAFPKARKYFKFCQDGSGRVGYSGPGGGSNALTAIGTLCYALTKAKEEPAYKRMCACLEDMPFEDNGGYKFYGLYYRSQAAFHVGPKEWARFNADNIAARRADQGDDGLWSGDGGPTFSTSAALLSLALNYRFLPIYER